MTIGLFLAITISLFAVGGAVILLWRYRDWRFGFLASLSLFASAWVLAAQASHLLAQRQGWSASLSGLEDTYPAMVMSLMSLSSIYFLERAIGARVKAAQTLKLAQLSLDGASIPVFWLASDGGIRYVNEAACRSLGHSRSRLTAMTVFDISPLYPPNTWTQDWGPASAFRWSRSTPRYTAANWRSIASWAVAPKSRFTSRRSGWSPPRRLTRQRKTLHDVSHENFELSHCVNDYILT